MCNFSYVDTLFSYNVPDSGLNIPNPDTITYMN